MNYSIELIDVNKKLGKQEILKDINLKLEKGKIYGLVGANGSGKSTLLKIILGLYKTNGKVLLNGYEIKRNYKEALKEISGIVDYVSLYEFMTAKENLRYFSLLYDVPLTKVREVLEVVRLDINDKKLVKNYSLGMKQKLGIAISLLKDPNILILDEPTNGLDPKGIKDLRELLKSFKDKTIIVSSHLISEIEKISTDILFINNKNVYKPKVNNNKRIRKFKLGNYELAKNILPNTLFLTDEEVSIYVKKLIENNVPVYAINDSSGLEDLLINMMGE